MLSLFVVLFSFPFRYHCVSLLSAKSPGCAPGLFVFPGGRAGRDPYRQQAQAAGQGIGAAGTHSTARAPGNGPATANSSGPIDASTIPGAAIRYRQALFPLWGSAAAPAAAGPTVFDTIRQEPAAGDTLRDMVQMIRAAIHNQKKSLFQTGRAPARAFLCFLKDISFIFLY